MTPKNGLHSTALIPPSQLGLTVRNRWSTSKFCRRILSLSLFLMGNAIVQLPQNAAIAAVPCTTMRQGDSGENVRALQQTLIRNGYGPDSITERFDEDTAISVLLFQREKGLETDSIVGPQTCNALIALGNSEFTATSQGSSSRVDSISPATPLKTPSVPPNLGAPTASSSSSSVAVSATTDEDEPYYVIIPIRDDYTIVNRVEALVNKTQLENNRLGSFMSVGGYSHRYAAESVSYELRREGLDARVVRR